MSGLSTTANAEALRTVYSQRIKTDFMAGTMMRPYVLMEPEFVDGQNLTILTKGQPIVRTRLEGQPGVYDPVVTGTFILNNKNKPFSGFEMTDEFERDSFQAGALRSMHLADMNKALDRYFDSSVFSLHKQQTTNSANSINGQPHRFNATGVGGIMSLADWKQVNLSFDKANVPGNRLALVDPTVAADIIADPTFQRQDFYGPNYILKEGAFVAGSEATAGVRYMGTVYGMAIFTTNLLDENTSLNHAAGGTSTANIFIAGLETFVGHFRKEPTVEIHRDTASKKWLLDVESEFYLELYRPESLVTVITV